MGTTRSVAKNTFLLSLGLMSGRLLSVFLVKKMSGLEGPEGMGIWGAATDLSVILLIIANYGLGNLITREVTRARNITWSIFWNALRIRWALGVICYGYLLIFVDLSDFDAYTRQVFLITGLAVFIESTAMACDSILQGHEKVQYQSLGQILSAGVYFGLGWVWLDAGHGLMGVVWANVISRVVRLGITAPLMFWRTGPWRLRGDPDEARPDWRWMLKLGLPMFMATTFGIIYNKVDTLMLFRMVGEAASGVYVMGHRALDIMLNVPNLFAMALFPAMTRYGMESADDATRFGERALRFMMVVIVPFTLFLTLVAGPIITWYAEGPGFADSQTVFMIVIWGLPLQAASIILSRLLLTANLERAFIRIGLVSMLVNVTLNILLIPRYSYLGASAATIVGLATSFFMHVRALRGSGYRPPLSRAAGGPLAATILSWFATALVIRVALPAWGMGWFGLPLQAGWGPFLASVGLFTVIYLLSVSLLGLVRRDELSLLRQLFARS